MFRHLVLSVMLAINFGIFPALANEQENDTPLTLKMVFQQVASQNLELKSKKTTIKSSAARLRQAGVFPNPEINYEQERLKEEQPNSEEGETSLVISEKLELWGKRKSRKNAAKLDLTYSILDSEHTKQTLYFKSLERYLDVISNQEQLSIAKKQQALNKQLLQTVTKQVQSGRLPEAELNRAEILWLNGDLEIEKATLQYQNSISKLKILWNGNEQKTIKVKEMPIPSGQLSALEPYSEENLDHNLAYQLMMNQRDQAKQQIKVEKSLGTQDPVLTGGIKEDKAIDSKFIVAGISIPLGIFDRNTGNIKAAKFDAAAWDYSLAAFKNELKTKYDYTYKRAHILEKQAKLLIEKILPKTQSVYRQIENGYHQGKYGYVELMNARQDWFKSQKQLTTVLSDYWKIIAELELIIGHSLDHQLPEIFSQTKKEIKND